MNFITNLFALFGMVTLILVTWSMADPENAPVQISVQKHPSEYLNWR